MRARAFKQLFQVPGHRDEDQEPLLEGSGAGLPPPQQHLNFSPRPGLLSRASASIFGHKLQKPTLLASEERPLLKGS